VDGGDISGGLQDREKACLYSLLTFRQPPELDTSYKEKGMKKASKLQLFMTLIMMDLCAVPIAANQPSHLSGQADRSVNQR
jgi:hypothetical protein